MKQLFILLIAFAIAFCSFGQRQSTTRKIPKSKAVDIESPASRIDTIQCSASDINFSGYEKTLRSNWESVFATNCTEDTLSSISMLIQYSDMEDRQLHQRTEELPIQLPPGETRQLVFKSWDKNKVWFYYLSEPTRTKGQITPYKVKITPLRYTSSRH